MALATATIIAAASLAVGVAGGYMQYQQQRKANARAEDAADAQRKAQSEQKAQNAQRAAMEQRQQIREERVRRAQILQQAENTGTTGSSGVLGATSNLSTNLSSNLGQNQALFSSAGRISDFNQQAADAQTGMLQAQNQGQMWGQVSSFGKSIFSQAGGFGAFKRAGGESIFDVSGNLHTGVVWNR